MFNQYGGTAGRDACTVYVNTSRFLVTNACETASPEGAERRDTALEACFLEAQGGLLHPDAKGV